MLFRSINEFLAHTDPPALDFIELHNHGTTLVNLSGCWLSDDPATNKFRIPEGTMLSPRGFAHFTEATLGFALSAAGEAIYLVNSNQTRVLDAVLFEGQENGVSTGRAPDGGPGLYRLAAPTPGTTNSTAREKQIVINEIMYHPITDDENDEWVELFNRGPGAVDLGGWRFTAGIEFTIPSNTVVAANGYLVVAKNVSRLLSAYTNLQAANCVGNFSGSPKFLTDRIGNYEEIEPYFQLNRLQCIGLRS